MFERLFCYIVNSLCCLLYKKEYRKNLKINSVQDVQNKVLGNIIKKNKDTVYGKRFHFEKIKNTAEFQDKVPLTVYDDYLDSISRLKEHGENELFKEPTLLLEITSGSTAASKLIPYNRSLKKEFQMGIKPWLYDLYTNYKGVKWGKSYWAITPATIQLQYTKSGIPIGFEEDSAYFGILEKRLIDSVLAVPSRVARLASIDDFYFDTAFYLLSCKYLTLISVWNPTYLILLLEYMANHEDKLTKKIWKNNKKRASYVSMALKERNFSKLWKDLKVISCWADGNAEVYAKKLEELFPHTFIQPKGLLATEGFVSFPFVEETGARLSVYSHFFEFQSVKDKSIYLAHELTINNEYKVVITTSGGLYRYQLNDRIKVVDIKNGLPLIKFLGKTDKICDLFGEKLSESFIRETLQKLKIRADFCMIAPEIDHYVLYIKSDYIPAGVDEALRSNFHYDYCRKLGQLKPLKIFKLQGDPDQEYINACISNGQKLGDIKPALLYLHNGLHESFKGEYV
jgi:hypothetical protein